MRRALPLLLLVGCTIDPYAVLNTADLYVYAYDVTTGGHLTLLTTDSADKTKIKRAPADRAEMKVLYEQGLLADGPVVVQAELTNADGMLIGCGTARGIVGMDSEIVVGFSSPSVDEVNCGECGNRCETDVSTGQCVGGRCMNWECAPGLENPQADGGCSEPRPMPRPDGGMDAGMLDDGGVPDAGPTCTPTAEDSVATCSDGLDNNCDHRVDCNDPGCGTVTMGCTIPGCGLPGIATWNCTTRQFGACVGSPGAENTVAACKDGIDNDCDGKTDCDDESCNGIRVTCGDLCAAGLKLFNCSTGLLGLCLPYIPVAENSSGTCGNGLDDDCDGRTDCADSSCRGRGCGTGVICCADGGCAASCN